MKKRSTPHQRLARRQERQEGAVLFLVLMIVALSTLGATFAVQDTTYALSGARGQQVAMTTRYAAETGINTLPGIVVQYGAALPQDLADHASANRTFNDDGDPTGTSFPHERLHMPPPNGNSYKLMTSQAMEQEIYQDAGVPLDSVHNDPRDPGTLIYENVIESVTGSNIHHYTVSSYGRTSMAWDPAAGTYQADGGGDFQQANDENFFHDTVSVARGFYSQTF